MGAGMAGAPPPPNQSAQTTGQALRQSSVFRKQFPLYFLLQCTLEAAGYEPSGERRAYSLVLAQK